MAMHEPWNLALEHPNVYKSKADQNDRAFSGELRLELRDNCLNIISQPGSKLVTELASTIIRESPRNEAIGHLALVFLLVEKGIVTEKEITQARLHATRLVDRELKTRGVALRKHYERRLAELRSKSKIGDGNLHFAIKSHQKAGRNHGKTSRFHGVDLCKRTRRWRARIKVAGEPTSRSLGYFDDELDAAEAYNIAAREAYGEHAHMNDLAEPRKKKSR